MEKLNLIEVTSTWESTGVKRFTVVTPGGEGKIQVDLFFRGHKSIGRTAYFWDLYVHPDHRRKGIAKLLMQRVLGIAKEHGFATATLEWDFHDTSREIAQWYRSLGFEEKEFSNTYALMVKNLS